MGGPAGRSTADSGARPGSGWASRQVAAMVAAWGRGERVTAAEVLERNPDIDAEAAIRLIFEEASLRREAGLEVDTSEVVRRYPRWRGELLALFECDRLLRPPGPDADFPRVGEVLGPFVLLDELGRGASGRTYLATDLTLADRPVVVKVIPDDQDEHLALARLRHTHIVPLFSEHAFPDRNLRGLCMPYLGGASLGEVRQALADVAPERRSGMLLVEVLDRTTRATSSPPPSDGPYRRSLEQATYLQSVLWIAACLADALHYAHERGLIHMDVKPSNVLIASDGQPLLLDFHLARGPIGAGELVAGRLGGTPGWMAPEQAAAMEAAGVGRPVPVAVDRRADIFAMGLLLREALAAPGTDGGGDAGFRRGPGVSVALSDIVRKCTALDPRERYPDAAALAEDLRRQLHDLPLRGVRNRSRLERWGKWRRRNPGAFAWGVAGLSAVLAAAVALAAFGVAHRQRVAQLRAALEDGRRSRAAGEYDAAIRTLRRGLAGVSTFPALEELRGALGREIQLSERGRRAAGLHEFADLIRFRHGIDLPSREDARALDRLSRTLWDRRRDLVPGDGLDREAEGRIRTDLLEVAAVWADLRVRLAPPGEADEARREALRLLDEAEASFGPSPSLDARREQLGRAPGAGVPLRRPRSAWEHYDLGRFYLRNGRIEEAAGEFRRTLERKPGDFWPNFYEGLCAFRLRRFPDALAAFRTCIALMPQSAICRYDRALAFEALGRIDEAHGDYSAAIELDPGLAEALLNRGILSYKGGRPREALADFERGLSARPDRETRGRLHYNLALAQLALGDRGSARANAEKAAGLGCRDAGALQDELR